MYCTFCRRHVRTQFEIDVHNVAVAKAGERSYTLASGAVDPGSNGQARSDGVLDDFTWSRIARKSRALSVAVVGAVIG